MTRGTALPDMHPADAHPCGPETAGSDPARSVLTTSRQQQERTSRASRAVRPSPRWRRSHRPRRTARSSTTSAPGSSAGPTATAGAPPARASACATSVTSRQQCCGSPLTCTWRSAPWWSVELAGGAVRGEQRDWFRGVKSDAGGDGYVQQLQLGRIARTGTGVRRVHRVGRQMASTAGCCPVDAAPSARSSGRSPCAHRSCGRRLRRLLRCSRYR